MNRRAALLRLPPARRLPAPRSGLLPDPHTAPRRHQARGGSNSPSPTAFPRPVPHSPPLRRSQHLLQQLSLPDWPSRDLMPISQSPPLAGPKMTNERLAAAWGRAQERRAEGVSASPPKTAPATFPGLCAHARSTVKGVCFSEAGALCLQCCCRGYFYW